MKTILIFLVAIIISFARAQEKSSSLSVTNVVKSPIIMRGIIGTRSRNRTNVGTRRTENAVMDALRMFKTTQNEDGSWGECDQRCLATPLVLMALLAHAETRESHEFGNTTARAHQYVLTSNPTNDAERISSIIALSEYVAVHVGSKHRERVKTEIAKIQAMLSAVHDTADNAWVQFLTFHHLPKEIPSPEWVKYTPEFSKWFSDVQANLSPENVEEYLALRLASLGKFCVGGKVWRDFNHQFLPKMIERQTTEGFYPCQLEAERFACTALAVQSIEVYYAWFPYYCEPPELENEKELEDLEVKIIF